ncbi:asialoglycoprotein receptor 1-like [Brachyhypopomus gauderio]|uniref:asialoglycoprotein receptor 1-like n=1 Tax=Brachyhypopomus gauderio TaxID=698409 RepID=UPI004042C01B
MCDNTGADNSPADNNEDHDEFDSRDASALWRKKAVYRLRAAPSGGQSRWCVCIFSVASILLLALILSISLTKVQVDSKFSTVQVEMSNLTLSLQSLTSKIQQLENQGLEIYRKSREIEEDIDTTEINIINLISPIETLREQITQLQRNLKKHNISVQICPLKWSLFSSHCYYFSDYGISWNEARDKCESIRAELLIIKSKEEKEFVISRTSPYFYWLGLTDERTGEWEWLDGTAYVMVRSEWMPGQPDNWESHGLGGGEDCAHFHRDGRYNDDHCSRDYRFVCKAPASTV